MEQALSQSNFAAGELSPKMRGRRDLPIYTQGAERIVNFISETSGGARFRSGFQFVSGTRRYQPAWLWPFQFNDSDSYEMEFTTGYIRFYRNGGIITSASQNITGVYETNPAQVLVSSHGLPNGTEVIISGVVGPSNLNNRSFVIGNVTSGSFCLYDNFGNAIDGTVFAAYVSGGVISPIYEVISPYKVSDVPALKIGQNADVLYIDHADYEPMKLTRLGDNSWTMATYTRTADPCGAQVAISAITNANPCKVTATAHGYSTGKRVIINGVVGMTQLNNSTGGGYFTITVIDANDFTLNGVDSTGFSAYTSGGYLLDKMLLLGAVAFYQGRLYHAYSDTYPESLWGSKPLDDSGNPQYDDFTLGTDAADAFKFTLSPISAKVDKIESLVPSVNFLAICTFEGISSANGGSAGTPITPSQISILPAVTFGCLQQITPIFLGISMLYIHRSGLIQYSFEYDIFFSAYNAMDKDLTNEHWSQSAQPSGSGIIQMVFQTARPTAMWYVRNDGVLIGRSYMVKENINGIHRHIVGGVNPRVISEGVMPRTNAYDQLWVVTQRTIGGRQVCFVEYQNDDIVIPELDDYSTGDEAADLATWQNAIFEAQKQCVYLDAALTYDGSVFGTNANSVLSPGATTGTGVSFVSSTSVFAAGMVGQQLWKQSQNGVGTGRAQIDSYVSPTEVLCTILTPFDNLNAMSPGTWYLTTQYVSGIWHLEGEAVSVVADGAPLSNQAVSSGQINIGYQASVVHVGLPYSGLLRTMRLHTQTQSGDGAAKSKTVNAIGVDFLNSAGASYGTNLYNMRQIPFGDPSDLTGRPVPLFSGIKRVGAEDNSAFDKNIYIQQTLPLPCNVRGIISFVDVDDQ